MAKPKKDSGAEISLFPFLSILASIIGCLTMIIVALSIIQMQTQGREPVEVERAKAFIELEKEKKLDTKKIDELKMLIDTVIERRDQINERREALKQIEAMLDESVDVNALRDELIAELNRLKKQLTTLAKDQEALLAQIEELKKELAGRKLPPDMPAVLVRPTGSGVGGRPYFAEVTAAAILLHLKVGEEPRRIPIASLGSNEDFKKVLDAAKAAPNGRILFLIRGDGIGAYNRARGVADRAGVPSAKLPLAGEGKLDLRMFEKFLQ